MAAHEKYSQHLLPIYLIIIVYCYDCFMKNEILKFFWSKVPGCFVDKRTGEEIKIKRTIELGPIFTGSSDEWMETLMETIIDMKNNLLSNEVYKDLPCKEDSNNKIRYGIAMSKDVKKLIDRCAMPSIINKTFKEITIHPNHENRDLIHVYDMETKEELGRITVQDLHV